VRKALSVLSVVACAMLMVACARSHTKVVQAHMNEDYADRRIRDVMVIAVVEDHRVRTILEKHFVDWFDALGVEAINSLDALPMDDDSQLEKADILAVLEKYENDTVVITHLVGFRESEVFSRDRPRFYGNYFGFYRYTWGYATWPTIYGERAQFNIETRLYDAKTESLIWAGELKLVNPKTTGEAIGQVVKTVMLELDKAGLLPERAP
jgi:hypothetical protein